MKYHTIGGSNMTSESRKSMLTLYTDPDFLNDKTAVSESEMTSMRSELEDVQRALKLQTRRCRHLVAEYTRRLQEKEAQYQSEKLLRDDQLAKVLRALLIFEARLRQEQKYISHQLAEKDRIIRRQREHIHQLSSQYCKHCNQFYGNAESVASSSEYVATDYHDSNFESFDSSSDTYATSLSLEKRTDVVAVKEDTGSLKLFQKNKSKEGGKRCKRVGHRKSIGDYYEVLNLRSNNVSSCSDNTSNDYEQFESMTSENISESINVVSDRIDTIFKGQAHLTEDNLGKHDQQLIEDEESCENNAPVEIEHQEVASKEEAQETSQTKINEDIPKVFEAHEESNDNWYASASDAEDDGRNWSHPPTSGSNPNFLEAMNQILLQNMNDNISSPPKTPPTVQRKISGGKRVKFSDEEDVEKHQVTSGKTLNAENINDKMADYYEAPIQKTPNFYETPQSIYSNDYEQILSKSSTESRVALATSPKESHYYVDMDTKSEENAQVVRKSKILRTPPALPPKPANLLSKFKLPKSPTKASTPSIESEPDYCSISELNLPPVLATAKKLNVVAEVHQVAAGNQPDQQHVVVHSPKASDAHYDLDNSVVASKPAEKVLVQEAKHTPLKTAESAGSPTKKLDADIPKLPQVSEIIIPDETPTNTPPTPKKDPTISSHDNYIKISAQLFKPGGKLESPGRRPILIGSSVSSLISTFNNQQLLAEMQPKGAPRGKLNKQLFSSFESQQSVERQAKPTPPLPEETTPNFEFDLSQNFEEFKLDECDIDEYPGHHSDDNVADGLRLHESTSGPAEAHPQVQQSMPTLNASTIKVFNQALEKQKQLVCAGSGVSKRLSGQEPNYEHFLECTGLSSKSIVTPSRLLNNHKNILKPKDVKYRSKTKTFERQGSTIKYWSEPYI